MSYSEVCDMIERQGYQNTFRTIYQQYMAAKADLEEKERATQMAQSEVDNLFSAASNFVTRAGREGHTVVEDGSHVVRQVIGQEVVHFRGDGDKIFIGYWDLTPLPDSI